MYTSLKTSGIGLLCLLILGCTQMQFLPLQESENFSLSSAPMTHHDLLNRDALNVDRERGKLLDRATCVAFLPIKWIFSENTVETRKFPALKKNQPLLQEQSTERVKKLLQSPQADERSLGLEWMQLDPSLDVGNVQEKALLFLDDPHEYVRIIAIRAIARSGREDTLELMKKSFEDVSEFVRLEAVRSLELFDRDVARPYLLERLHDPSALVRGESIAVLQEQDDFSATSYLWEFLDDAEGYVRDQAAQALQQFTGQDMGYDSYLPPDRRRQVMEAWRHSWEATPRQ